MPVPEGLAVENKTLGEFSNMAADLVIQDGTSKEIETPSIFKAEIINYPEADARDPIIASSENNINIIFTISKEKFRRMALAVLDHCEKDKKHEEFSQTSSDLAADSCEDRIAEKDTVYEHVSSSEDITCINAETISNHDEEKIAETASKCPELELESKETSNISFTVLSDTIISNYEKTPDILEASVNSPLKGYVSEEPDGVKKPRDIVESQNIEIVSCHNESEIQVEFKSPLQKTESKRIESNCTDETVIDKLRVAETISISREFTVNEFSDMFPTMKTEEIEILKIEPDEGADTFTKYFKLDLANQFVVLKITTVDENFLMNAYKFKVIGTDSVTHANTATENPRFGSQCIRKISSKFSNEKPIVPKADSPKESINLVAAINSEKLAENEENFSLSNNEEIMYEKNTVMDSKADSPKTSINLVAAINSEKLAENEDNFSLSNNEEIINEKSTVMDTSNISVGIEDGDLENQSTCSNETNKLIEQSLDLERSQELDQKEIIECSKISQPAEFSEFTPVVVSAKLLDLKANTDTPDTKNISKVVQSSVKDNRLECSLNTEQCLKANSMENTDSLNVTFENLEIEQTESAENTSLIATSNLEVREQSFKLSFSEFADENSPKMSKNEKADFKKSVEDNLENLSEEMVSEENETVEDPDNIEKCLEDCLNADVTFTVPETETAKPVYAETSEILIAKIKDSPELIVEKLIKNSIGTDSGASESKPKDNSLLYSEYSGIQAEKILNVIGARKCKKKCEAVREEIEAFQSSKNELQGQLTDDVAERLEKESCEGADIDMKTESIEETEDVNETKSSIDVYENEAETYEITKCEPQNEIVESHTNTPCFEKDIEKTDTLVIAEDEDDVRIESVEKLGLESSIVETKESTMYSEFDESSLTDKEETLHSKKADLSLDVSAIEMKTELEISVEPESAADEYTTDSETTSERDALEIEEVKSVASESDDSRDSESSRLIDRNSKKLKSDEVDCAPTRLRVKKSKLSEDVIPENSVVSKSSRSFLKVSKSKSTSKVSPIERSLRSRSLEPIAEPAKSKATTSKTDSAPTNRKRAATPEVIMKKDIKTAVRSSPRKFTRAASLADTSKPPKNINRSNIEDPTTSNASSSGISAPKKRTAKRNGTDK